MSKAVMISIRPKECEKICGGKKTVEVRKTRPKLETPFKCYIYCTMDYPYISVSCGELDKLNYRTNTVGRCNGKVIGEFVCDTYVTDKTFGHDALFNAAACMGEDDATDYANGSPLYGWHISDLVIYDEPIELARFHECSRCDCPFCWEWEQCHNPLKRAPQSWYYVEEM